MHALDDFTDDRSATAIALDDARLFGHRTDDSTDDTRPLPDDTHMSRAVADIFDALISTFIDTRLESELDGLLWSTVSLFHRAAERIERRLDDNEQAQRLSQRSQDGSEVRSVELERLLTEGGALIERRDAMEAMRDHATLHYEQHAGHPWQPRAGSLTNRRALTAALIDSRDFIAARNTARQQTLIPCGARIALTGGYAFDDHRAVWAVLDRVHAKHADMVLLHGGAPKGAEHIAHLWARQRGVTEIAFKPDFVRHGNAAPFKRNDALLDTLPIGVIVFPGNGINDNLADKARKLGIPLFDCRKAAPS